MNFNDFNAANTALACAMFPRIEKAPEYYEQIYPVRGLEDGARVTRIAPSPTGYLHLGVLFTALINKLTAVKSDGIFFFRLEDTDKKREVEGGTADILAGLNHYGVRPDEGFVDADLIVGDYGPYQQSVRGEIYQTYVKDLVEKGLAYPCFCTEEQRAEAREVQERDKVRTGYYGRYAVCRDMSADEAISRIEDGQSYVVRLKSNGSEEHRIKFDDMIKGTIEMPENDEDIVILKSDGIPTYHFAHAIDDHLMRTTHVIRGDEWISSVPKHIELFKTLGFRVPKYAHVSPIMKDENGARRKLSKRKDPEAAVHFYAEQGYPTASVLDYLMTIASSEFEDWRRQNAEKSFFDFNFNLKKMSSSGALFDLDKLNDVSKTIISRMNADEVARLVTEWARDYDSAFYDIISSDARFLSGIFAIDRGGKKPRKDIAKWSDTPEYCEYFYDATFAPSYDFGAFDAQDISAVFEKYIAVYDENHDKQQWFDAIKAICEPLGFCPEVKEYKQNPDAYKGHVGDVSGFIRMAITGRKNTPDLHSICVLLGRDTVQKRLEMALNSVL